ncbi:MAG: pyruvate kinase [Anaerolineae bacterium]
MSRTRIVCTLGPATNSEDRMRALIRSGMNVARFNFSHGTREDHARRVELVRRIAAEEHAVIALLGDLQGPKIRVGEIPNGSVELAQGETVAFALGKDSADGAIPLAFPFLGDVLKPDDHFLMDDGNLEVQVLTATPERIEARVVTGGTLSSHKGVNLPSISLPIPALTEKDAEDADWAVDQDFDYMALSFVRKPQDVLDLRLRLAARGADIPIIAKIEKPEAVALIDAILEVTDGVMVARGDLGVELPAEQVPIYQKQIIHKANKLGKPVITATQMLESMIHNPRPTRAEASDVANAILDGSDAVMLSGETSVGSYPVEAVRAMAHIAEFTERNLPAHVITAPDCLDQEMSITDAIGLNTVDVAEQVHAKLIVTLTTSGYSARMVSRHRPNIPMLAVTTSDKTRRRLALVWGAQSELVPEEADMETLVHMALTKVCAVGAARSGDRVVLTAGVPPGAPGRTNMLQVRHVP